MFGLGASYDEYDVGKLFDKIRYVENVTFLQDIGLLLIFCFKLFRNKFKYFCEVGLIKFITSLWRF